MSLNTTFDNVNYRKQAAAYIQYILYIYILYIIIRRKREKKREKAFKIALKLL